MGISRRTSKPETADSTPMQASALLKPVIRSPPPAMDMIPSIMKLSRSEAHPFSASKTPNIRPCSSSPPVIRIPFISAGQKANPPVSAMRSQMMTAMV